jgi:predicted GIY-YIG superfamily endonuclease
LSRVCPCLNAMTFTVYVATFTRQGATCFYVGMTETSLAARRRWHLSATKGWLSDMEEGSLRLRSHTSCDDRGTALAQEAVVAAELIAEHGEALARGGPWCLSRLLPQHRKEMDMVLGPGGGEPDEVRRLARKGGDLWKHLNDKPYRGQYALVRKPRKVRPSGNQQRQRMGLTYGGSAFAAHKYGSRPAPTAAEIQTRYNATRPHRKSGH